MKKCLLAALLLTALLSACGLENNRHHIRGGGAFPEGTDISGLGTTAAMFGVSIDGRYVHVGSRFHEIRGALPGLEMAYSTANLFAYFDEMGDHLLDMPMMAAGFDFVPHTRIMFSNNWIVDETRAPTHRYTFRDTIPVAVESRNLGFSGRADGVLRDSFISRMSFTPDIMRGFDFEGPAGVRFGMHVDEALERWDAFKEELRFGDVSIRDGQMLYPPDYHSWSLHFRGGLDDRGSWIAVDPGAGRGFRVHSFMVSVTINARGEVASISVEGSAGAGNAWPHFVGGR